MVRAFFSKRRQNYWLHLKITLRIEHRLLFSRVKKKKNIKLTAVISKILFYHSKKQNCNIVVLLITYIVVKPFWHWALLHLWLHPYYTWGRYYICGFNNISVIQVSGLLIFYSCFYVVKIFHWLKLHLKLFNYSETLNGTKILANPDSCSKMTPQRKRTFPSV